MSKPKFTPGPWVSCAPSQRRSHKGVDITTFSVYSEGEYFDDAELESKDVVFHQVIGQHDFDEFVANSHLIAAAPEMYEMLETIAGEIAHEFSSKAENPIYELLARARGES